MKPFKSNQVIPKSESSYVTGLICIRSLTIHHNHLIYFLMHLYYIKILY